MNAHTDLPLHAIAAASFDVDSRGRTELGDGGVIGLLMHRAMPYLTCADLRCLVNESHEAERIAARAAVVANGVASLVQADADADSVRAGNFQDGYEIADLLLHFAGTFEHLAGLARIGSEASSMLESIERTAMNGAADEVGPAPGTRRNQASR
jgi:hypothetical protein